MPRIHLKEFGRTSIWGCGVDKQPKRERGTFLQWLITLAVIGVFGLVLYPGILRDWNQNGVPSWMVTYERWEKRQKYEWGLWWKHRNSAPSPRSSHASSTSRVYAD